MLRVTGAGENPLTLERVEALRVAALTQPGNDAAWRRFVAAQRTYRQETLQLLASIEAAY